MHDRRSEQCTPHNGEQVSLNFTTDEVSSNNSGIHAPAEEANEELAKYLEEYVRDVNEQDGDGHTPLHFAVANDNKNLAKFLINTEQIAH